MEAGGRLLVGVLRLIGRCPPAVVAARFGRPDYDRRSGHRVARRLVNLKKPDLTFSLGNHILLEMLNNVSQAVLLVVAVVSDAVGAC
jgi:hypothetical protein